MENSWSFDFKQAVHLNVKNLGSRLFLEPQHVWISSVCVAEQQRALIRRSTRSLHRPGSSCRFLS